MRCQTESRCVQTVPDETCLVSEHPRRKVPISRLSGFKNFSALIVRSKNRMSRFLCFHNSQCQYFRAFQRIMRALQNWDFVRSCLDYRAFKNTYVQTFLRSKSKFLRFKIECLCVPVKTNVRSKTNTFGRSKLSSSTLLCIHRRKEKKLVGNEEPLKCKNKCFQKSGFMNS